MKKYICFFLVLMAICLTSCTKEHNVTPFVPFDIVLNNSVLHVESTNAPDLIVSGYDVDLSDLIYRNGDTLFGNIVIDQMEMTLGTNVKKIDCRLGNIVIGTTENQFECPFSVPLIDKPIGTHTISIIIKCQAPGCDLTYQRVDLKLIVITDKDNEN